MRHLSLLLLVGCLQKDGTSEADTDSDTDADTDSDTDADTDSDTDTDTDADTDSDTDADTDADTDTDPNDLDGDGYSASVDCDDADPTVHPGADDVCDGIDNNCDGIEVADEDLDGDGELDCIACPNTLFLSTQDLTGAVLVDALQLATSAQFCDDYSAARIFMFGQLDSGPTGVIEGVYTGVTTAPDGTTTPGNFNTEHTWPQSQGAGAGPARCDLHHLYPTDMNANSSRGSFRFGIVTTVDWEVGGSKLGTDAFGATVFEPRDVHKGNAARSLLYFSFRYPANITDPDDELGPVYTALLRGWSAADPPDDEERLRSLAIEAEQGSANPLVVCPHLVDAL